MEALSTVFDDIRELLGADVVADVAILTRWKGPENQAAEAGGLVLFLKRLFSAGPSAEEEKERERLKAFESEVRKAFRQVFVVPYSPAIYETQQQGLPISHYAPESDAGRRYRAITTAIQELETGRRA
jgi:chromosome partitioning protein